MPQMNGSLVAEQLTELYPGLKVLYVSGYNEDIIVRHGVIEGGVAFLAKPFTPATLTRKSGRYWTRTKRIPAPGARLTHR